MVRELQIVAQRLVGVIAVDVDEPRLLDAQSAAQSVRRQRPRVALPGEEAFAGKPGRRAMRQQAAMHAFIRPVEHVDAERAFAGLQSQRHGDEEAALEGADLHHIAGDAELGLAADHMAADRGGEARRHARHARIASGKIAVDGGVAAGDIDHPLTTFWKMK